MFSLDSPVIQVKRSCIFLFNRKTVSLLYLFVAINQEKLGPTYLVSEHFKRMRMVFTIYFEF